MNLKYDIVVFCHLRWSFVWQRPQHILSRLASDTRVFYIEEPVFDESATPSWRITEAGPNLFVFTPVTNVRDGGFHPNQIPALQSLIVQLKSSQSLHDPVAWCYTPMAVPLLESLQPSLVVYDCMDELSAFLHAPPELLELENQLLQKAALVFTGGPSLYRAKCSRHPHVYCFSSSVDAAHFGKAKETLEEPHDQASLPHPRLGFFGVVDERFDVDLLAGLAERRPEWQFVIVGPVVKIEPSRLPHAANIHYLGQRKYEELPAYLSGWDVSLLPFAKNASTKFISPTKTLEYMAAEKAIVSTSITDVVEPYSDIVYFGDTVDEFEAACVAALEQSDAERDKRVKRMDEVLKATSWDRTVRHMADLITEAISSEKESTSVSNSTEEVHPGRAGNPVSSHHPVVVVGAGPTGLSATYHLGKDALLLERNDTVGGWCRSIEVDGFTFDFAGHIMFSNDSYVHEMYKLLLGDNVHWQDREAWVYSKAVFTRYPFQGALYGLPPDVIRECIMGAIEARFGSTNETDASETQKDERVTRAACLNGNAQGSVTTVSRLQAKNGSSTNGTQASNGQRESDAHSGSNGHSGITHGTNRSNGHSRDAGTQVLRNGHDASHHVDRPSNGTARNRLEDCCADGIIESTAELSTKRTETPKPSGPANFEEFIYQVWGKGIAKHFAIPYNRKLWAVPLTEMETSWLGGRVPMPDLEEMIDGALSPVPKPMGPNARFGYPLRGGFQALMDGFIPHIKSQLRLNADVAGFSPSQHQITLRDGSVISYDQLISTMPLPVLVRLAGDEAPEEVKQAAAGLRYISVRCVHIGIGREAVTDKHWIYYPEDTVFHRIFVQGNASPHCNPPGGFGITCEITYRAESKPLPYEGEKLIQRCIDDCRKVGIIKPHDEIWTTAEIDMPHAYVLYDHARTANVTLIRDWLGQHDVILAGRYSEWEYYNSDHAFLAGKKAAEKALSLRAAHQTNGHSLQPGEVVKVV
ncbi:FAD-dependent oxidoreductase [Schlesneria sp. T3-172]|uniref:FAD-dependent oxidoreductase n=1 Tax=Schlesneria sphaerica TaxID=3373610 RepID=UPI0037CBE417